MTVAAEVLTSKYVEEKYTTAIDCDEASPSEDFLCNGFNGVEGLPYCDKYDEETRTKVFPELRGCWDREIFPLTFCKEFGDLEGTYEYCRQVPESEEYIEYLEIGGPDESCLFDVEQIKCLPSPITDECPEKFGTNEDGQCFPLNENGDWECPEGYHDGGELDETGQCYPNNQECDAYTVRLDGTRSPYVLTTRSDGVGQTCKDAYEICEDDLEHEACGLIERSTEVNSDDDISNDIPPYGTIFFCDHPLNPDWCYDRNDNPEEFCVNNPQYMTFCDVMKPVCDDEGSISSTDPECTDEGEDCPENYVRYNEYCAQYRVNCDVNPFNVYCNDQRRTDGLLRCDEPSHPGYKFCTNKDN
jgi:hypothetical protein